MSISTLVARKVSRERGAPGQAGATPQSISDALAVVAGYIPSEIVALYTMVLGIVTTSATRMPLFAFMAFVSAVAPTVWLLYAVREREAGNPIPWKFSRWPTWEMISGLIAFTAWSAALPRGAMEAYSWYRADYAAIMLLVVSIFWPILGGLAKK